MYKPRLYELQCSQEMINTFGGYNKNAVIDENLFYREENMSGDSFPLITPRNKRAYFNVRGNRLHGLFAKTKLCYINNGSLYYGGQRVSGLTFADINGKRHFVSLGAKLIVFPDKVYINTADLSDYGSLEASFKTEKGTSVTCDLCRADSDLYEGYTTSSTEPASPKNNDLWLDTSVTPNVLKQFSESLGIWAELAETYVRISVPGIGKNFNLYDGVEISGMKTDTLNGSHIIRDKGDNYITVSGVLSKSVTQTGAVKIKRTVPDMDFVCENGNRIWGCSSKNNEIYASKLGDPTNFNCFMGVSTDSYAVSVGTDGEFTGATSYRGYIIFFKENCIHKIYGQNPPYTVNTSYIRGIQKGSGGSLVCLNETLYYKSLRGVCAFESGIPVDVSEALGNEYYTDAVAGAYGDKYYICMTDKHGERNLFVYDERRSMWHREDNINVTEFVSHNGNLYYIAEINGEKRLCLADGENRFGNFTGELSGFFEEEDFEWYAETGLWGLSLPENKYYSAVIFRFDCEKDAMFAIDFEINSSGKWEEQLLVKAKETGSVSLPFTTPRCDRLRIRIRGTGKVKLYSVSRKTQTGSELNV